GEHPFERSLWSKGVARIATRLGGVEQRKTCLKPNGCGQTTLLVVGRTRLCGDSVINKCSE
uniref:hypothetical protein n=1 Tax=Prevotellamassilia timonensis TaxID=1852370 RepID=UPI004038C419